MGWKIPQHHCLDLDKACPAFERVFRRHPLCEAFPDVPSLEDVGLPYFQVILLHLNPSS